MKTIIKIKTWGCSNCGYHQDFEPTQENLNKHFPEGVKVDCCPACFLGKCPDRIKKEMPLLKETNPDKKITMTVMGEEDIETEIEQIKDRKLKGKDNKNDPDVSTVAKENAHRGKRKEVIRQAIIEAKKLEDK